MSLVKTVFPVQVKPQAGIVAGKLTDNRKSKSLRIIRQLYPKVTNVVDAGEAVLVEVPAYDRAMGKSKDPMNCAMARACARKFDLDGAIISLSVAYLIKGDTATRFSVPPSLSKEVVAYDRSHKFEPGTYQLSAFSRGDRLGKYVPPPRTGPSKKHRPEKVRHMTEGVRSFPSRATYKAEE